MREREPVSRSDLPSTPTVHGRAALRKVGRLRFPVYELATDGEVLARLGRRGWWRIFMGRGQRIELSDGTRWRLRAVGVARAICPVIVDSDVKKIALATPNHGGYGINGRDWAYALFPARKRRFVPSNRWILREHETDVGQVSRTPAEVTTTIPVPLGAIILALTLTVYDIPGESDLGVPQFHWGAR